MTNSANRRDNEYWAGRLTKDGHENLLARVRSGELTMFKATQLAGYRKKQPPTPSGKLSYHWMRASAEERAKFILAHAREINRTLRAAVIEAKASAQKTDDPSGK